MMMYHLILHILSFVLLVQSEKCDYGKEQTVGRCLQPMLEYAAEVEKQTGSIQFPLHGGNIFKNLCKMFQHFQECVSEVHCQSISVQAMSASYGYMCGEGVQLFEEHAACFAKVEVDEQYLKCKNLATNSMNTAQNVNKNTLSAEYLSSMCAIMDEYLRCSHPLITAECGEEAWHLVSRVTKDSLRVTMPDCDMQPALI